MDKKIILFYFIYICNKYFQIWYDQAKSGPDKFSDPYELYSYLNVHAKGQ